jgi:HEAT repeat protein
MNSRLLVLFLLVLTVGDCKRGTGVSRAEYSPAQLGGGVCKSDFDLNDAIRNKLSSENYDEAGKASTVILQLAERSSECRSEIVKSLMHAMNQPDLDFIEDRRSYHLWSAGAAILGELKAVESLDLLIDHLNQNDGQYSASMVHQPAVHGVKAMGALAVPKLGEALRQNGNRDIRLAAALCLVEIGGQDATEALKQALKWESDPCVRRFVELNFEPPTEEVLKQRVLAFRCGN